MYYAYVLSYDLFFTLEHIPNFTGTYTQNQEHYSKTKANRAVKLPSVYPSKVFKNEYACKRPKSTEVCLKFT